MSLRCPLSSVPSLPRKLSAELLETRYPVARRILRILGIMGIVGTMGIANLVAPPEGFAEPSGLAVVSRVRDCRASLVLKSPPAPQEAPRSATEPNAQVYTIWVKSPGSQELEPAAVLRRTADPQNAEFPYVVDGPKAHDANAREVDVPATSSTLDLNPPLTSEQCRSLVGMTATPLPQGASSESNDSTGANASSESGGSPDVLPQAAPRITPGLGIPATVPATVSSAPPSALPPSYAGTEVLGPRDADAPPLLILGMAGTFSKLQTAGLKVDSNDSLDTSLIGPRATLEATPLAFARTTVEWLKPFALSYELALLESPTSLDVQRNGVSNGSQDVEYRHQALRVSYRLSYLGGTAFTSVTLTPWSRSALHTQLSLLSNPPNDTLRDVTLSCLGGGLAQGLRWDNGLTAIVSFESCLQAQAQTPQNLRAEFPNSRRSLTDVQNLQAHLEARFPLPGFGTAATNPWSPAPARFSVVGTLGWERWLGSLALDDGQIIDAELTQMSTSLGLSVGL